MAYHETRLQAGDPADGPLGQVIVFVDDDGTTFYPGDTGYIAPEEGSAEFLADQAQQLAEDQTRIATGQDQQFTPEQRENTLREADQRTEGEPVPVRSNYPQQANVAGQPQAEQSVPQEQGRAFAARAQAQDPNAQVIRGPQDTEGPAGDADPNAQAPDPKQDPNRQTR